MALINIVKYDGDADVFAYKHPNDALSTWTQLIVNNSQEAILIKGGKLCDTFGPGRYTLSTENIPLLRKIANIPFGGRSPFTAEVWFINKLFNLDIKWGTPSPIQLQDPKYKIIVPVRANGIFGINISEAELFLTKLVGTLRIFDKTSIINYFRGLYITKVKDILSQFIKNRKISVLEINAHIDELSEYMNVKINPVLNEYGIDLTSFYINEISFPENDPSVKKLRDALAKKAEMDIIGYNYQQERSFDTLESATKNAGESSSSILSTGLGLSMGIGMGSSVNAGFRAFTENLNFNPSDMKKCPRCNTEISTSQRFCGNCGYDFNGDSAQSAKVCNKCGTQVSDKQKFCPECGSRLSLVCPKCGHNLNGNPKFCPECGTSLNL